jgi:hypothetical protein
MQVMVVLVVNNYFRDENMIHNSNKTSILLTYYSFLLCGFEQNNVYGLSKHVFELSWNRFSRF